MEVEVGDRLYCHNSCIMTHSKLKVTTVGNFYTVKYKINNEFSIIDDVGDNHHFYVEDKEGNSWEAYTKWFCDIKKERRLKLKKIEENLYEHQI